MFISEHSFSGECLQLNHDSIQDVTVCHGMWNLVIGYVSEFLASHFTMGFLERCSISRGSKPKPQSNEPGKDRRLLEGCGVLYKEQLKHDELLMEVCFLFFSSFFNMIKTFAFSRNVAKHLCVAHLRSINIWHNMPARSEKAIHCPTKALHLMAPKVNPY